MIGTALIDGIDPISCTYYLCNCSALAYPPNTHTHTLSLSPTRPFALPQLTPSLALSVLLMTLDLPNPHRSRLSELDLSSPTNACWTKGTGSQGLRRAMRHRDRLWGRIQGRQHRILVGRRQHACEAGVVAGGRHDKRTN